ncbi:MAG: hypothetical protein NTZ61_16265 [Proteobacteria bacterium]|nr:hypothetical protein [Pseudomonadota bacterium]
MTDRDHERGPRTAPPPRSADEAMARARQHGLAALAESALALRALVDAVSLAATGAPSDAHAAIVGASSWLDQIAEQLQAGAGRSGAPWLDAVARVLDAEIERWETRGRDDPEARAVLRAFLGVREILWEFGLRPAHSKRSEPEAREPSQDAGPRRSASPREETPLDSRRARVPRPSPRVPSVRIERVPVKG